MSDEDEDGPVGAGEGSVAGDDIKNRYVKPDIDRARNKKWLRLGLYVNAKSISRGHNN